jgi:hypothetical protein
MSGDLRNHAACIMRLTTVIASSMRCWEKNSDSLQ